MSWSWLVENFDLVVGHLRVHLQISAAALALGAVVAFPLGVLAYRWPAAYPFLRAAIGVVYTVPALALFAVLIPVVGLGTAPVVLALASYSLVILVANVVEALRGVPRDVVEAATAVGYGPAARLWSVELPLAVPTLVAGLRTAAVSTISLVSLGALIGTGGLGQLFIHGFQVDNPVEIWTGMVGSLLLALLVDMGLLTAGRAATPWISRGSAT